MSDLNLREYLVHLDEPITPHKDEAGRGCFGTVYKSKLNGAKCVVKKLHDILTGTGGYQYVSESQWRELVDKFRGEIELLSKQRHPNIVQFLGVCGLDRDPRNISLVMEQLDMDLAGFIKNNKGRISLSIKLSILRDIACGVSHLHSSGIVHRDLNAGNVLLTSSLQAKVSDLGVSRIIDSRHQYLGTLSSAPGATHYMPPEALQEPPVYGPKLDCFSFGHLTLYLTIEEYPQPMELCIEDLAVFLKRKDGQTLSMQIQKRRKWIEMLGDDDHSLNQLIYTCLEDSPEKRPDMKTARKHVEEMMVETGKSVPRMIELMRENEEKENILIELRKEKEEQMKSFEERVKVLAGQIKVKEQCLNNLKKGKVNLVKISQEKERHITELNEELVKKEERIVHLVEYVQKILAKAVSCPPDYEIQEELTQPKQYQRRLKQRKKYTGYDSSGQYHAGNESYNPGLIDTTNLFRNETEEEAPTDPKKEEESEDVKGTKENGIPDYQTQKSEIQPILSQKLKKGDEWYLVDQRWLKQWKRYTGYHTWDEYNAGNESYNPGPVDNANLLQRPDDEIIKEHLMEELDYSLLPKSAWEKLSSWYKLTPRSKSICRRVVEYGTDVKNLKVEVYLFNLKVCVHPHINDCKEVIFSRADTVKSVQERLRSMFEVPKDVETRLWQRDMTNSYELMKNPEQSLADAGIHDGQMLMLEKKNKEGKWVRDLGSSLFGSFSYCSRSIASTSSTYKSGKISSSYSSYYDRGQETSTPGLCGLSNLDNTCFMNSALQCLSNTVSLTEYFLGKEGVEKLYRKHINKGNPLGTKGALAETYGELLEEMWSGKNSCLSPRQFKMMIDKHAPQFSGNQQHDSHEFLAFMLDGLHEDLNLVKKKPYVDMSIKTDGRDDRDIAAETWHKYLLRNQSVIVSQFQGQLKSTLNCPKCEKESLRTDPLADIVRYQITVPKEGCILELKEALQKQTGIDPTRLIVIDAYNSCFHRIYYDKDQISSIMDRDDIYLYELTKPLGDTEWAPILVYMRELKVQKSYSFFSTKSTTTYQVFGLPIVVTVPRGGCTYRQLYSTILDQTKRYVTVPAKNEEVEQEVIGEENLGRSLSEKANQTGDLFKLVVVNSYGSQEEQKLEDDGKLLKLLSSNYVSCDWNTVMKENCYNIEKAKEYIKDRSCDEIFEQKKELNIFDCLDLFVQNNQLGKEEAWFCPKCKEHVQAFKKFDLWKLPEVLVIHLKRFYDSKRNKVVTRVDFPLTGFDLSEYVVNEDHVKPIYDLYAVSNHFGRMGGGHYTAVCKNKITGKWYSFDDRKHSEVYRSLVCSPSSYILFFARRQSEGRRVPESLNHTLSVSLGEEVKAGKQRFHEKSGSQLMGMDTKIEEG